MYIVSSRTPEEVYVPANSLWAVIPTTRKSTPTLPGCPSLPLPTLPQSTPSPGREGGGVGRAFIFVRLRFSGLSTESENYYSTLFVSSLFLRSGVRRTPWITDRGGERKPFQEPYIRGTHGVVGISDNRCMQPNTERRTALPSQTSCWKVKTP